MQEFQSFYQENLGPIYRYIYSNVRNQQEAEDRVQAILQALPERYREVLIYRFLVNLTVRETALRMGLSEANVKVVQFRALKYAANLGYVRMIGSKIAEGCPGS